MQKFLHGIFMKRTCPSIVFDDNVVQACAVKLLVLALCILFSVGCDALSQPTAPLPVPQIPPQVRIEYPLEYPHNLVGDNIILTVEGKAAGADWLEAIVEGATIARIDYKIKLSFVIDIEHFGSNGQKALTIRAGNEIGTTEQSVILKNNDNVLTNEALNFVRNYWRDLYDGTLIRFNSTTVYVKNKNLPRLQPDIDKALDYWRKWSGINFIVTENDDTKPIMFIMKGNFHGGLPGFNVAKIWLDEDTLLFNSSTRRLHTICHEIGHAVGINHHPVDGSIMDITVPGYLETIRFHPYQQKAVKIVYSMPPGSKL